MASKKVKQEKESRRVIRIVDPPEKIFNAVTSQAEKEKRSIGKQAEFMLEKYIESQEKSPSNE